MTKPLHIFLIAFFDTGPFRPTPGQRAYGFLHQTKWAKIYFTATFLILLGMAVADPSHIDLWAVLILPLWLPLMLLRLWQAQTKRKLPVQDYPDWLVVYHYRYAPAYWYAMLDMDGRIYVNQVLHRLNKLNP